MINEISINSSNTIQLSRGELLLWLNELLNVNITKIQQLGTGSVYCQLLDLLYPGKVQLTKVNFKAKNDYEYICNFKILQQHFTKFGILRNIDVEKLIKCKYQDNLQFLQWFKKIFDNHYGAKFDQESLKRSLSDQDSYISQQKQNKRPIRALNFSTYQSQKYQNLNEMPKLQFSKDGGNQRMMHSSTSRTKIQERNRKESISFIKPSTERINATQYRAESLETSAIEFVKQISAIEQVSGIKNKEPYYSPSRYIEKENFYQKQHQNEGLLNEERQFYLKKFKQIEHLLQIWQKSQPCQKLVSQIRKVVMMPPSTQEWKVDDQTGEIFNLNGPESQTQTITSNFQQVNEQRISQLKTQWH